MDSLSKDPIINAINNGIRRGVDVAIETECFGAAVILLFAGIDAMGNLNRPETRDFSDSEDFKEWVRTYFHLEGETRITPDEWWAARNAIVHTFGGYSRAHQTPGIRRLGWMVGARPYVKYNPRVDSGYVLADILGMREAFFSGMERFLIESFANDSRRPIIERRINEMVVVSPVDPPGK